MAGNSNELLPPSLRGKLIGGEKITGGVTGLAILAGLGVVAFKVLPLLIVLLANTLYAGILAIAVVALGFIAINFKSTAKLMFALFVRKIHNQIIKRDAYDFVRYMIVQGKIKLDQSRESLAHLRGSINHTKGLIDKNEADIAQRTKLAKAADQIGKTAQRDMQARMVGQIDRQNQRLKLNYTMLTGLSAKLQSQIENGDMNFEREVRDEFKTL